MEECSLNVALEMLDSKRMQLGGILVKLAKFQVGDPRDVRASPYEQMQDGGHHRAI